MCQDLATPEDNVDDPERWDAPEEGDIITSDHRRFFQYGKLVLTLRPSDETASMWKQLDAFMSRSNFWPNVFVEEERGGYHLLTREPV